MGPPGMEGIAMPVSEAKKKANARYNASKDNIMIRPDKEEGAAIRSAALAAGQSNQQYILQAARERMKRDATQRQSGAGVVSLPSGTPKRAGGAADAQNEGISVRQAAEVVQAAGMVCLPSKMMETVKAAADAAGETDAAFLWRAISALDAEATQSAGVVALPVETVEAAKAAADRTGEDVPGFISRAVEAQAKKNRARKKPVERP